MPTPESGFPVPPPSQPPELLLAPFSGTTLPPFPSATVERLFFERLMESLPDLVYFKDTEGHFICVNQALAKHIGVKSPADAVGKSDYDFFLPELAQLKDEDEREIIRTGTGFTGKEERAQGLDTDDRWVLTSKLPLYGPSGEIIGTFGISRDITDSIRARKSLQEQHQLFKTLIEILPCRIFIKDRDGRFRLVNEAYRSALGLKSADEVEGKLLSEIVVDARTNQVAIDDRTVLEEGKSILNREEFDASPASINRWILLSKVPLRDAEGSVQGIVGVSTDITSQKEAEANAVAAQRALEQKNQQMEADLALACELQTELMTSSLQTACDELDPRASFKPRIASLYVPSAHLAGDFFYVFPLTPTRFGVLLCDVMGHGVKAALVTTLIRGLVTDLKVKHLSASAVLEHLNERLCFLLDRPSMPRFVTAVFAVIDIARGTAEISNAGHPWPLVKSAAGEVKSVASEECGPALGIIHKTNYQSTKFSLGLGSQLLFFTDGLIEEVDSANEEFGVGRLIAALAKSSDEEPAAILAQIASDIQAFTTKADHNDDQCAVLACF